MKRLAVGWRHIDEEWLAEQFLQGTAQEERGGIVGFGNDARRIGHQVAIRGERKERMIPLHQCRQPLRGLHQLVRALAQLRFRRIAFFLRDGFGGFQLRETLI
jgi:hypothetical protein